MSETEASTVNGSSNGEYANEDIIRILLASDIHLGIYFI